MKWRIHYSDRVVEGSTREDWQSAPDDDVQVIVEMTPYEAPHKSPWKGVWDRRLWTGEDRYDPFDWGVKRGKWTTDENYKRVWDDACS